jgi:phosphohistidine phosphatase SixA
MRKVFLWLAVAASITAPAAARAEIDAVLLQELRAGGYVLYMRHASTDFSQNDANMKSYGDCPSQRNLTDKGRAEARAVGEHVKRLGIPIGTVLASPFCRTMATARLAFGKAQPMKEMRGGPARSEDPARYDGLKKLLSTPVAKGENLVIASHANPFYAVAGPPYLAEGEIAVVRPQGGSSFGIVGKIRVEDWQLLK